MLRYAYATFLLSIATALALMGCADNASDLAKQIAMGAAVYGGSGPRPKAPRVVMDPVIVSVR